MITNRRVHYVTDDVAELGFTAPQHARITGHANAIYAIEVLTQTPTLGIVGHPRTLRYSHNHHDAHVTT